MRDACTSPDFVATALCMHEKASRRRWNIEVIRKFWN